MNSPKHNRDFIQIRKHMFFYKNYKYIKNKKVKYETQICFHKTNHNRYKHEV